MPNIALLLLLLPCLALSQQRDFSSVDSLARTIKYEGDIYKLTKDLTNSYNEEILKVRAIFIWITENIAYDYEFLNKEKEINIPECASSAGCEQIMKEWEKNQIKKVLKNKKAICMGYTMLFQKMCEIAGIKSWTIDGYVKTRPYQVGMPGSLDHSWNAVLLDSTYYFLDATWAAGTVIEDEESGKLLGFKKDYEDYYWFTPFHDLARNHYPREGKWIFEANYTKEKFAANPYYSSDIISEINLISPASGVINAKKGDTIHFKFNYTGGLRLLQLNSNIFRNPDVFVKEKIGRKKSVWARDTLALKRQRYVEYKREGTLYQFDYIIPDDSIYYIDILFDYRRVMRFKIKSS